MSEEHTLILYYGNYKSRWTCQALIQSQKMREMLDAAGVEYRYYPPGETPKASAGKRVARTEA